MLQGAIVINYTQNVKESLNQILRSAFIQYDNGQNLNISAVVRPSA